MTGRHHSWEGAVSAPPSPGTLLTMPMTPPKLGKAFLRLEDGRTTQRGSEASLVVQWLRLCLPMQGAQFRSLLGELRSHMLQCGQKRKRVRLNGVQGRGAKTLPRARLTPAGVCPLALAPRGQHSRPPNQWMGQNRFYSLFSSPVKSLPT